MNGNKRVISNTKIFKILLERYTKFKLSNNQIMHRHGSYIHPYNYAKLLITNTYLIPSSQYQVSNLPIVCILLFIYTIVISIIIIKKYTVHERK